MTNKHFLADLQEYREERERAILHGRYTPEQLDWRRYQNKEREPDIMATEPSIDFLLWFSHCLLIAAQGSGKTNLIRWRIQQILPLIKEGKATLILFDPKDVLTREPPTLARRLGLEAVTWLIDPLNSPVSFDLFDKGDGSPGAVHDTIARLIRLLNTITLDMTAFQKDALAVSINALFAIYDQPSFEHLFPILRKGKDALPLDKVPANVRDIFEHDFQERDGKLVMSRLNTFRNNPYFTPLVMRSAPSFNLLSEMQAGRLILIKAGIKEPLYGKIWIEQLDRVIDARLDIPEEERTPTFIIIDEAQIFIGGQHSEHFVDILDRAREARVSMMCSVQHMDQLKNNHVRGSLYNSAIKFVARTNADLHDLARSMAGTIDANSFKSVPKYHFLFSSADADETELVKLPRVDFPKWKWEDVRYFYRKRDEPPEPVGFGPREPPPKPALATIAEAPKPKRTVSRYSRGTDW